MIDLTNFSISNYKTAFDSGYQGPREEHKPKTKAKLSQLKAAQSKSSAKLDNPNRVLAFSLAQQTPCNISSAYQKENETTNPTRPSKQSALKNNLTRPTSSSTYKFFNECQRLEMCKYSRSRQADRIKEQLKDQLFLTGDLDDKAVEDVKERRGKFEWKLSSSNHPETLTAVKIKRGKTDGVKLTLGEFIQEKCPKYLVRKPREYQHLKIDLTCFYDLRGLGIED